MSLLNNVLFTHALTNHVHVFKTCGVLQMSLLFPILYVAFRSEVLICPFWCKKIRKKTKTNQHQLPDKKNAYFLFALSYILSICLDHNQRVISLLMQSYKSHVPQTLCPYHYSYLWLLMRSLSQSVWCWSCFYIIFSHILPSVRKNQVGTLAKDALEHM